MWVCMVETGEIYEFSHRRNTKREAYKDACRAVACLFANVWISELIQEKDKYRDEEETLLCENYQAIINAYDDGDMTLLLQEQNALIERRREAWNRSLQERIKNLEGCYSKEGEIKMLEHKEHLQKMFKEPELLTMPVILSPVLKGEKS